MRPKHLVQRVQLVKVEPRFRDGQPTSMLIKKHFASSSEACHMFRRRALNSDLTGMARITAYESQQSRSRHSCACADEVLVHITIRVAHCRFVSSPG